MGAVVTRVWPTEPEARAFAAGVELVNDGAIADLTVEPTGDGQWSVRFTDDDADPEDYADYRYAADAFTEADGPWICLKCDNRTRFIGVDLQGSPGPKGCGHCGHEGLDCDHFVTLSQVVTFSDGWQPGAEPIYDSFVGGPSGSEIAAYTRVECAECDTVMWESPL